MQAYDIHDRMGRLALTVVVRAKPDAERATLLACDDRHGPYRLSKCPLPIARAALSDWRNGWTTDKAVDLTTNEGWEDL